MSFDLTEPDRVTIRLEANVVQGIFKNTFLHEITVTELPDAIFFFVVV